MISRMMSTLGKSVPPLILPTLGLMVYYPFNGDRLDYSGNSRNPTANTNTFVADDKGGQAAEFYSLLHYVIMPNYTLGATFSVTARVKVPVATAAQNGCILRTNNDGWNGYGLEFGISAANSIGCRFSASWCYGGGTNPGSAVSIYLPLNTWYNVVAQRIGNILYLYIDGSLVAQVNSSNIVSGRGQPIIGMYANGNVITPAKVYIDEFRIYNRALSQAEINILAAL
jgi:hypothetical protein